MFSCTVNRPIYWRVGSGHLRGKVLNHQFMTELIVGVSHFA